MRSKLIVGLIFFSSVGLAAISAEGMHNDALFSCQSSIGTGYVYYGSSSVRSQNESLSSAARFIITGDTGFSVKLADRIRFTGEGDFVSDMYLQGSEHIIRLDYALLGGIQFYPGWGGVSFSLLYALGRRTDFLSLDDETGSSSKKAIENTSWGNGFKFAAEYDFSSGTSGWAPIIGVYWKRMPRGDNDADNYISVYFRIMKS